MSYDFGVDVLGAGPTGSLTPLQQLMQIPPTQPAQMAASMPTTPAAPPRTFSIDDKSVTEAEWMNLFNGARGATVRQMPKQSDAQFEADKRLARNVFVGGVVGGAFGALALGAGGAYLWPTHRILGFLLGSMFGWPLGSTVGGTIGATR